MGIRELREQVQGPRASVDSWYGRYVMRSSLRRNISV